MVWGYVSSEGMAKALCEAAKETSSHEEYFYEQVEAGFDPRNSSTSNLDDLVSEVYEDDSGMSRCSHCNTKLRCNESGDMPINCPACGKALNWSPYDHEKSK